MCSFTTVLCQFYLSTFCICLVTVEIIINIVFTRFRRLRRFLRFLRLPIGKKSCIHIFYCFTWLIHCNTADCDFTGFTITPVCRGCKRKLHCVCLDTKTRKIIHTRRLRRFRRFLRFLRLPIGKKSCIHIFYCFTWLIHCNTADCDFTGFTITPGCHGCKRKLHCVCLDTKTRKNIHTRRLRRFRRFLRWHIIQSCLILSIICTWSLKCIISSN